MGGTTVELYKQRLKIVAQFIIQLLAHIKLTHGKCRYEFICANGEPLMAKYVIRQYRGKLLDYCLFAP